MSDAPVDSPDDDLPEWWKRLSPEEQAALRRVMGENWRPSHKEEIQRAFDLTRERIRQIEQRALRKLRDSDGGDDAK
jgi:DNA-directed RNA polymerase sigma subunit (sigma70/sigma32)